MRIPEFLLDLAASSSQDIYLVGGAVRDLLLGIETIDYDLLCERDAIIAAKELEAKGLCTIKSVHPSFATAKILLKDTDHEIDLATPRQESYAYPGALPQITFPVPVAQDLSRRDFSINAICLSLSGSGEMVDPYDGQADLSNKTIRALHQKSYYEDPTRMIRAIRFAVRLGYTVSALDRQQISDTLLDERLHGLIEKIRGIRFGVEIRRMLELDRWLQAACLCEELGLWVMLKRGLSCVNSAEPDRDLLTWQGRLIWLLLGGPNSLMEIERMLGFDKKNTKSTRQLLDLLSQRDLNYSLKAYQLICSLPEDYQNILFMKRKDISEKFMMMRQALPDTDALALLAQGVVARQISAELESIFQDNLVRLGALD